MTATLRYGVHNRLDLLFPASKQRFIVNRSARCKNTANLELVSNFFWFRHTPDTVWRPLRLVNK